MHSVDSWLPPYGSPCRTPVLQVPGKSQDRKFTAAMAIPAPKSTPASTRFDPPSPKAKVSPPRQSQPRTAPFNRARKRLLQDAHGVSQGDWPLTCANAADARSETDFFRKAFFIAGEFLSDDAGRAPHRDSKAMGQLGGGLPQLQLSAPYAHRPAQPSPARGYLSHTSTPN